MAPGKGMRKIAVANEQWYWKVVTSVAESGYETENILVICRDRPPFYKRINGGIGRIWTPHEVAAIIQNTRE